MTIELLKVVVLLVLGYFMLKIIRMLAEINEERERKIELEEIENERRTL